MISFSTIKRLFRIETRFEAWVVTYAIALGSVERAQAYLAQYPGAIGWIFAAACTGVVFLAGAKLLDSVKPAPAAISGPSGAAAARRVRLIRNPPRARRSGFGSDLRPSRRTDSPAARRPLVRPEASPEDRTHSPDR